MASETLEDDLTPLKSPTTNASDTRFNLRKKSFEVLSSSSSQSISSTISTSHMTKQPLRYNIGSSINNNNDIINNLDQDASNLTSNDVVTVAASDEEGGKKYKSLTRDDHLLNKSSSSSSSSSSTTTTTTTSSSMHGASASSKDNLSGSDSNQVLNNSVFSMNTKKDIINNNDDQIERNINSYHEASSYSSGLTQISRKSIISSNQNKPPQDEDNNLKSCTSYEQSNTQSQLNGSVGNKSGVDQNVDNTIQDRLEALEKLVKSAPMMIGGHSIGCEMLIDFLNAVYYECQNSELTRNKYQQKFLEIFQPYARQINELRLQAKDFDLVKVIGFGNFGQVSVVKSKYDGTIYAMKTLNKVSMLRRAEQACYREERDILLHGRTHDCFTKLHYAFQDETNLYLIMDYYVGGDLLTLISKYDDFLPEEMGRFYAAEIIKAISALHDMGYIHRDIKPDNILLDKDGHARLADFGSCIKFSNVVWDGKCTIAVGTPDYISPDVLKALEGGSKPGPMYDFDVDWWSLGVVIFECLFGETPFYAESLAETYSRVTNHETCFKIPDEPKISDEAKDLINNLICAQSKRFKTFKQFKEHNWFKDIDWDNLRNIKPPYSPVVSGPDDTSNFDTEEDLANSVNPNKKYDIKNPKDRALDIHLPFIGYTATFSSSEQIATGSKMSSLSTNQIDVIDGILYGKTRQVAQQNKSQRDDDDDLQQQQQEQYQNQEMQQLESDLHAARQQWCELSALVGEIRQEKTQLSTQLRTKETELEENLEKMTELRKNLANSEISRRQQGDDLQRLTLELDRERNKGFTYQGEIAKLERRVQIMMESSRSEIDLITQQQQSLQSESAKDELIAHQKDYIAHMEEQLLKLQQQQPNWDNQVAVACKLSSDAASADAENIYINSYPISESQQQLHGASVPSAVAATSVHNKIIDHSSSTTTWQTRRSAKAERHEFNELQLTLQNELEEKRRVQNDLEDNKRELCQALSDLAEVKLELARIKNEQLDMKRNNESLNFNQQQMPIAGPSSSTGSAANITNRPLPLISQSMLFNPNNGNVNNNSQDNLSAQINQHQQHHLTSEAELRASLKREPGSMFGVSQSSSNYQIVSNLSSNQSSYFGSSTTTTEEGYSEADSAYRRIGATRQQFQISQQQQQLLQHQQQQQQQQQNHQQQYSFKPSVGSQLSTSQSTLGPISSVGTYVNENSHLQQHQQQQQSSPTAINNRNIYANREILERHHQQSMSLDASSRNQHQQHHHQRQQQIFQQQHHHQQQQLMQQHQQAHSRHMFVVRTFIMPLKCNLCTSLMVGLIRQGLVCESCGFACHAACSKQAITNVPCPYDDKKLIGLDPQRGIGTAYSGYVRIPKPGGVKKGWMRIYVVVCDFKLFLYDLNGGDGGSNSNSSSVSLVGGGNSSSSRDDSSLSRNNSGVSVSRIVDLRDENFSVTSVLENDVIHASRTDISCIFRLSSTMIGDEKTSHTHRKLQYQLMLVDRESEKVKWIEALHELHRIIKRNNLPTRNLLTPYCMLTTSQMPQLRQLTAIHCCALIHDLTGTKLLLGTDEALICCYLDLQVYHKLAKGKRVLQLDLLEGEQLIVAMSGRQKHTKLIPMRALESDQVAWIKMPETKNATTFVVHKNLQTTTNSYISVAVKKSLYIYEITRSQLRYAPWREIHSNANIVSLNASGAFVCVGTYSNFHVHNILSRDGPPLYLINQDCDQLLYMVQNPFEPLACISITPDKWLLVFENHGIYVDSMGYKTNDDTDLQFVTKCNAIATLSLDPATHDTTKTIDSSTSSLSSKQDKTATGGSGISANNNNSSQSQSYQSHTNINNQNINNNKSSAATSSNGLKALLLLVFSTHHIDVYDTSNSEWLQTINLKDTKPMQRYGTQTLICMTGALDLPMMIEITAKSDPQFRLSAESINLNQPFALKSTLVGKLSKMNSAESTELQRKVSRVYISEPSDFQHIRHMGPSNQPCLIDLNNKNNTP